MSFVFGARCSAQKKYVPARVNYAVHHSYDVLDYDLSMDWFDVLAGNSSAYRGVMKVTFVPDSTTGLSAIDLDNDQAFLKIDSAFSGGKYLSMTSSPGKININLERTYASNDTGLLIVYYHVKDTLSGTTAQKGFYLFDSGETVNGLLVTHTIAYTMSEPSDARDWMPCYDDPSDKASCEISIRVPDGYVAASNGTLVDSVDNHDGSKIFDWREDYPIATYLMCATAARFSVVTRNFTKGDGSSIPIQYYVYPEDFGGAVSNSTCDIDTIASMIKFYESLYGFYPFDKYGMTGIEPFYYGGMEHETITTLKRNYEFRRDVVAHELAHQWWGDMVTLGTWKDIWLNESFATYSEAMQLQHLSESEYKNEMQSYERTYFQQVQYAIYAPQEQGAYLFDLAEYYKGAWVLSMLRNIVGDSTFFAIMRTYRTDFQFGNAVTSDFENVVNQVTHSDMNWFFDEWIFQPGFPVYSFNWKRVGSSVVFYLKQEQTDSPIFKMPVEFAVYSHGNTTTGTFVDSTLTQAYTLKIADQPDSVVFDPDEKLLSQVVAWTDTTLPFTSLELDNFPNPFNTTTQIRYTIPEGTNVSLEVFDVIGRKVMSIDEGYQEANTHTVEFDGRLLASGVYICRLRTAIGSRAIKILLEK